eukprot:1103614-Prymnesium_polylepis.1
MSSLKVAIVLDDDLVQPAVGAQRELEPVVLRQVELPVARRRHPARARAHRRRRRCVRHDAWQHLQLRARATVEAAQRDVAVIGRAHRRTREAVRALARDRSPRERRRALCADEKDLVIAAEEVVAVRQEVLAIPLVELRERKMIGDALRQRRMPRALAQRARRSRDERAAAGLGHYF